MKLRYTALVLSAVLLGGLGLGGCAADAGAPQAVPETTPQAETEALYTAGTYTASAQGFGGAVTVTMTFSGSAVTEAKVEGPDETESIGGQALAPLAEQIMAAQGNEIDGVSGATYTSDAARAAAGNCIAQANGTASAAADTMAYTPGTYTSVQQGHGGQVEVQVTFSADRMTGIETLNATETPGICDKALYSELPQRILEAQSLAVDSISGATLSSNAVKSAVLDCAEQAGANAELLYRPLDNGGVPAAREMTADVIIVGGGGAGLAAAVAATDAGASVIIVEKSGYVGGNSLVNGGIYNTPNPELQQQVEMDANSRAAIEEALGEEPVSPEHAALQAAVQKEYDDYLASGAAYLFDSADWYALQTWNGGDKVGDLDLVRTMAEHAYEGLQWLYDIGWQSDGTIIIGAGALYQRTVSSVVPLGKGMIDAYTSALEGRDCTVVYNTTAESILMEDGAVVGVTGTAQDRAACTFRANKGVILSTGGFSGNSEMVEQYNTSGKWPSLAGLGTTNLGSITGDGIRMAAEAGASLTDMEQIQLLYLCDPNFNGETARNDIKGVSASGQIFLNKEGRRFVREDGRRDELSLAVLDQTDQVYWVVTCADAVPNPDSATDYSGTSLADLIAQGRVVCGDTFEEMCEGMGVPVDAARAELDAYNADVEAGVSADKFGRVNFMSMTNGPWYAALNTASVHHTMGGVTIDSGCHVLDKDGGVIDGLYAAGEVTGGVHGGNRLGGNAIVDTVVFGRIAGTNAAQ